MKVAIVLILAFAVFLGLGFCGLMEKKTSGLKGEIQDVK